MFKSKKKIIPTSAFYYTKLLKRLYLIFGSIAHTRCTMKYNKFRSLQDARNFIKHLIANPI